MTDAAVDAGGATSEEGRRRPDGETVLDVRAVRMTFGGITALADTSFGIRAGEICGLIGPNGAGKTTLFNCISGLYRPDSGSIVFEGTELLGLSPFRRASLGIARTFQNLGLFTKMSVLENVLVGAHHRGVDNVVASALRLPKARASERTLRRDAFEILDALELTDLASHEATALPFGTLKRVELARALMSRPRLLLLDEPASGLAHAEVAALGELLVSLRRQFDLTLLLVEHHMSLVMSVSDHVVALDFGRVVTAGTPQEVREHPRVIEAYLGGAA